MSSFIQKFNQQPLHAIARDMDIPGLTEKEFSLCKFLLMYLASRADKKGECHPSYALIQRNTGMNHQTITNCKNRLKRVGLLDWDKGHGNQYTLGKGVANHYRLNVARMKQLAEQKHTDPDDEHSEVDQEHSRSDFPNTTLHETYKSADAKLESADAKLESADAKLPSADATRLQLSTIVQAPFIQEPSVGGAAPIPIGGRGDTLKQRDSVKPEMLMLPHSISKNEADFTKETPPDPGDFPEEKNRIKVQGRIYRTMDGVLADPNLQPGLHWVLSTWQPSDYLPAKSLHRFFGEQGRMRSEKLY